MSSPREFPSTPRKSWSPKKKLALLLAAILVAFAVVDICLARMADTQIRRNNADLHARLSSAILDEKGKYVQACELQFAYRLYPYQTCFFKFDGGFEFVYHRPVPLIFGYGRSEDAYYFKERFYGENLATIRKGVVVKERLATD